MISSVKCKRESEPLEPNPAPEPSPLAVTDRENAKENGPEVTTPSQPNCLSTSSPSGRGGERSSFRKRSSGIAPPFPPGYYIRTKRHFRSLFHRRPTRRRLCRRHGKSGIRAEIRRHRSRGRESFPSGLRECPVPRAGGLPGSDGARPGRDDLRRGIPGSRARGRVTPRTRQSCRSLAVCRVPPLPRSRWPRPPSCQRLRFPALGGEHLCLEELCERALSGGARRIRPRLGDLSLGWDLP